MSQNRKNSHYHYAEKFEDRRIRAARKQAFMPFKAVIASLVVLLMLGLVSTTFGAYVVENEPEYNPEEPGIISEVRNIKSSRDIAVTGARVDLAATGYDFSGVSFIFDNTNTNWSSSYTFKIMIGYGTWSSCYTLTKIPNTNLYGYENLSWGNATQFCIIAMSSSDASGWGDEGNSPSNRKSYATKYTNTVTLGGNYSGFFYAYGASTSNNCALTFSYTGDGYGYYNYAQTIRSYTSSDGTNYYSDNTGGLISVTSAYKVSGNTSSTSSSPSEGVFDAAKTSTVTLSASASTGYRFVGWYNTSNTQLSTSSSYSYTVTGANEVRARFIKRATVTVAKNPTGYTGSPSASPATVDVGSTVTLSADVKTGVTFGGWTFSNTSYSFTSSTNASSNPCYIKPTANLTATAKYTLQVPTSLSLSYPTIVSGNTSTPTKSATSPSSGTLTYRFTSITPQSGTTAASGTYSVNATTGVVTASTPGKYTVTMSVTTTAYGLTSSAATKTATVTVKPVAPSRIAYEATNFDSGSGTYAEPYKIPINRTRFSIKSYIPVDDRNSSYTYNWTRTDGTYLLSNGTITAGTSSKTTTNNTEVTDTASATTSDVIHNYASEATKGYIYKIAVTSRQNGVDSDPYYYTFYYGVTADFLVVEKFDFNSVNATNPIQKIYAEDNTIDHIDATYDAGGTNFDTMLWFSKDNINKSKVAVWTSRGSFSLSRGDFFDGTHSALPNDAAHKVSTLITSLSTIARNSVNLMRVTGPKWFFGYIDDFNNGNIAAQTPGLHTTVGTSSTVANRPIYYVDSSGITHTNSRVMAFYMVSSDDTPTVHYQTGQVVKDSSDNIKYYRFYIPSDATKITFAHVANNNYVLPTYNTDSGILSYSVYTDSTVLMAWTPTIDLTDAANAGKTTYKADTPGTPDANGIYNYTNTDDSGHMTTL